MRNSKPKPYASRKAENDSADNEMRLTQHETQDQSILEATKYGDKEAISEWTCKT
jgi:hypothetical protein